MAVKKNERRKPVHAKKLMDAQDTRAKGDSRAYKDATVSFTTTKELAEASKEVAYQMRISRSELIERAIRRYLKSIEQTNAAKERRAAELIEKHSK